MPHPKIAHDSLVRKTEQKIIQPRLAELFSSNFPGNLAAKHLNHHFLRFSLIKNYRFVFYPKSHFFTNKNHKKWVFKATMVVLQTTMPILQTRITKSGKYTLEMVVFNTKYVNIVVHCIFFIYLFFYHIIVFLCLVGSIQFKK